MNALNLLNVCAWLICKLKNTYFAITSGSTITCSIAAVLDGDDGISKVADDDEVPDDADDDEELLHFAWIAFCPAWSPQ